MEPRLTMFGNEIGAKFAKRFANASLVIAQSPLPKPTQELVSLRASQINGCGWFIEPRIPAQIRALARVRHRAKDQFAVLEGRLDPGDPRRPVGSHGGKCLVPVRVEQRPHAPRELRLCPFDIPPCRHASMIATGDRQPLAGTKHRKVVMPFGHKV
jgi:hypothetical protein